MNNLLRFNERTSPEFVEVYAAAQIPDRAGMTTELNPINSCRLIFIN